MKRVLAPIGRGVLEVSVEVAQIDFEPLARVVGRGMKFTLLANFAGDVDSF
jgi:hypothetical protein